MFAVVSERTTTTSSSSQWRQFPALSAIIYQKENVTPRFVHSYNYWAYIIITGPLTNLKLTKGLILFRFFGPENKTKLTREEELSTTKKTCEIYAEYCSTTFYTKLNKNFKILYKPYVSYFFLLGFYNSAYSTLN